MIRQNVECDKLDEKSYSVSYHTIFVVWSQMELDGTCDVIISLLEKDNIIHAHCFKDDNFNDKTSQRNIVSCVTPCHIQLFQTKIAYDMSHPTCRTVCHGHYLAMVV